MKLKVVLWAAAGLLAGGCAQQQASRGGAFDFSPLPLRDTATSDGTLPTPRRSLGKPIPATPGHAVPADDDSQSPGPDLLRRPKRYEAFPI
jgi:hypothetical protein